MSSALRENIAFTEFTKPWSSCVACLLYSMAVSVLIVCQCHLVVFWRNIFPWALPLVMLFHSVFTILVHVWLCALHMNLRLIMLRNKLGSDSFIGLGNFAGVFNLGRTDIFISHPRTRNVFAFVLVCFSAFQMDFQIFSIEVLWLC